MQFLESSQAKFPEQAQLLSDSASLYNRKLWHQLTDKIEGALQQPAFLENGFLIPLYDNFVAVFAHRINLLRLAHIAVTVSQQYKEPQAAVAFLERVIKQLADATQRNKDQPALFLRMHIAQYKLHMKQEDEAKVMVEEGRTKLDAMQDVDPSVSAIVHLVASLYYKQKRNFAEFYKASLLYLAYTQTDALPPQQRLSLAVDISLAALLGENVYNFGELLLHPIVDTLDDKSGYKWLREMLECFNAGDLHRYDQLCSQYKDKLNAEPALTQHVQALRQKITILCLMELIFSLPAEERTIRMQTIADKTKLQIDGVEFLLMKTLSLHLIEGVIDEVAGSVQVSWVQPRVLTMPQIDAVRQRLDNWIGKVTGAALTLEEESADVMVA